MFNLFPKHEKVTYLHNEHVDYISYQDNKTYKIFGTPYCHEFGNWPFMRNKETLINKYSEIPDDVDILITHDAPNIGDMGTILQENCFNTGINAGNEILTSFILNKKPKYVFCGHIHSGSHVLTEIDGINFCNCSIVNEKYNIIYKPIIIRI